MFTKLNRYSPQANARLAAERSTSVTASDNKSRNEGASVFCAFQRSCITKQTFPFAVTTTPGCDVDDSAAWPTGERAGNGANEKRLKRLAVARIDSAMAR